MSSYKRRLVCVAALTFGGFGAGWTSAAISDGEALASAQPLSLDQYLVAPQYAAVATPQAPTPPPQPAAATATPAHGPLMSLLDQVGIGQSLESARINIYGHVEGSYNYNFNNPAKDLNLGRVFDINNNRAQVNQLDLNIERTVDLTTHQFDVGGRVEMLYGTDARFIHANGLLDHQNDEYQFDLPQAYVDVALPVGNGLVIRAGKFLFFKQIDPNASVFFSHSFTFGAALPFTLTGVTATYHFSDQLSVEGGISRGWGQSLDDNNGAIDGLVRVRYTLDERTNFVLAAITGPELDDDNGHYRSAIDLSASYQATDNLTLLLDAVYGVQAAGAPNGSDANWYGVAGYGVYRFNDMVSLGGRLEWYRDEEGFTTAIAQTLYEATVGLTITPFPNDPLGMNFKIRPEVRYDYSSRDFFDGLSRHDQTTVAVDAIFNF